MSTEWWKLKDAVESVFAELKTTGIREMKVFVIPDEKFKLASHGRYFRFDQAICEVDVGAAVLEGKFNFRRATFALKELSRDVEAVEAGIQRLAGGLKRPIPEGMQSRDQSIPVRQTVPADSVQRVRLGSAPGTISN